MKKSLLMFALSVVIAVSGYSQSNDSQPEDGQALNTEITYQQTVALAEPVAVVEDACDTCNDDDVVEEKAPVNCAKEVKVVRYNDRCNGGCGFPVTVRVSLNCSSEEVK